MNSSYITSAQKAEQLPIFGQPEVAFIGRSNCGKSSLLNALLGRTGLARTSQTPGRTQMVNFFSVKKADKELILADLPGYGYSAIARDVRRHWEQLLDAYFARPDITALLFLIDIRRAETPEADDLELIAHLARRRPSVPVTLVLTKADKVSSSQAAKIATKLRTVLAENQTQVRAVVSVSSLKKKGIEALRQEILAPVL